MQDAEHQKIALLKELEKIDVNERILVEEKEIEMNQFEIEYEQNESELQQLIE